MNKENLLKLADFLDTVKPEAFDIELYSNGDREAIDPAAICGTVACALGWGPMVIPPTKDDFLLFEFHWPAYCRRAFGIGSYTDAWHWCFDSAWGPLDNTPTGAAKRIRYLVERGVPHNWTAQTLGDVPYMFAGGGA